MAVFLMIHGAWHGGWSFDLLRDGLEVHGHTMVAPDLPGTDGNAALARATLAGWADFVAGLARSQAEAVILCGHSRGGIVISEAAERAPEAIAALVYISAFLVPDGSSLADFAAPHSAGFAAGLRLVAGGTATAVSSQAAISAFYNRVPETVARNVAGRLVPEPVCIRSTRLSLSPERYGTVERHYIECSDDRMIPIETQRAMQKLSPVASSAMLNSDHSPSLSCSDDLLRELLRVAAYICGETDEDTRDGA